MCSVTLTCSWFESALPPPLLSHWWIIPTVSYPAWYFTCACPQPREGTCSARGLQNCRGNKLGQMTSHQSNHNKLDIDNYKIITEAKRLGKFTSSCRGEWLWLCVFSREHVVCETYQVLKLRNLIVEKSVSILNLMKQHIGGNTIYSPSR